MENPGIWLILGGVMLLVGAIQFGKRFGDRSILGAAWLVVAFIGLSIAALAWGNLS